MLGIRTILLPLSKIVHQFVLNYEISEHNFLRYRTQFPFPSLIMMLNMTVDEQKATFHSFVAVGLFEACTTNSNGNPAYIHVIFVRIMAECLYLLLRNMYEVSSPSTCVV